MNEQSLLHLYNAYLRRQVILKGEDVPQILREDIMSALSTSLQASEIMCTKYKIGDIRFRYVIYVDTESFKFIGMKSKIIGTGKSEVIKVCRKYDTLRELIESIDNDTGEIK